MKYFQNILLIGLSLFSISILSAQKNTTKKFIPEPDRTTRCCECELRDLRKNDKAAYKALMKQKKEAAEIQRFKAEKAKKQALVLARIETKE